jgi:hypothetical protein
MSGAWLCSAHAGSHCHVTPFAQSGRPREPRGRPDERPQRRIGPIGDGDDPRRGGLHGGRRTEGPLLREESPRGPFIPGAPKEQDPATEVHHVPTRGMPKRMGLRPFLEVRAFGLKKNVGLHLGYPVGSGAHEEVIARRYFALVTMQLKHPTTLESQISSEHALCPLGHLGGRPSDGKVNDLYHSTLVRPRMFFW